MVRSRFYPVRCDSWWPVPLPVKTKSYHRTCLVVLGLTFCVVFILNVRYTLLSPPSRPPAKRTWERNAAGGRSEQLQQLHQSRAGPLTAAIAAGLSCPVLDLLVISAPALRVDSHLYLIFFSEVKPRCVICNQQFVDQTVKEFSTRRSAHRALETNQIIGMKNTKWSCRRTTESSMTW